MRCVAALLLLLLFSGCSSPSTQKELRVGVDPSWFPLAIPGREQNVTGFSTELLKEIAKIEKLSTAKVTVNWDDLIDGLYTKKYNAILSSMPPYVFNMQTYDFSELYLTTGPVLMVASDSSINSLKATSGREIAVIPEARGTLLEKYPGIIIRPYDSIPTALNAIVKGEVDGALVNILSAVAYCQDLYQNKLKIVTPVLTDEGLRLVTLHKDAGDWTSHFNRGLAKLKSSGAYDKLLLKWGLKERCQP